MQTITFEVQFKVRLQYCMFKIFDCIFIIDNIIKVPLKQSDWLTLVMARPNWPEKSYLLKVKFIFSRFTMKLGSTKPLSSKY